MLRFVLANEERVALANEKLKLRGDDFASEIPTCYEVVKQRSNGLGSTTPLTGFFDYLQQLGVIRSENDCKKILDRLAGNYYCYRNTAVGNKVVKGHLFIPPYDVYTKVPSFIHRRLDDDNKNLIISKGSVVEINDRYVLSGFVVGPREDASTVLGIKTIVINKGSKDHVFDGIYLCSDVISAYEFGRIKIKRTNDKFDRKNIATEYYADMPDINYKHLFLSPANWRETTTDIKSAIVCSFTINNEEKSKLAQQLPKDS